MRHQIEGRDLVGLEFETFFPDLPVQAGVRHPVIPWEEIDPEEGSGVVHIAPGCGPEDYELSKIHDLAVIAPLDAGGNYVDGFDWLHGRNATAVANEVAARLRAADRIVKDEPYEHSVPVCWRCKSHVLFRLVDEWFISVDDIRAPMLAAAETVSWEPPHTGARMSDWLHNMGDWCISRKRYWGLPLPFYRCDECSELTVVGSRSELRKRAIESRLVDELPELHRPWIDEVKITCASCGQPASRVPEVGDAWLDAGIVPFSTLGYFDDPEGSKARFPAQWISEMREQVRLWYYSMLFMSVVLEGRAPYERALSYERVISETGEKFSKTGHMIRFDDAVAEIGADPIRYLFCRQPPGAEARFGFEAGAQAQRRLAGLWNIASFFDTYAGIDRVQMVEPSTLGTALHVTDRWLLARTAQLIDVATEAMGREDTPTTVREAEQFIEEVSNWYVRVNRRRFWRESRGDTQALDKVACHSTLFEGLRAVILVLAPIVPFIAEELWQEAVRPDAEGARPVRAPRALAERPSRVARPGAPGVDAGGARRHQYCAPAPGSVEAARASAASLGDHRRGGRDAHRACAPATHHRDRAQRQACGLCRRPLGIGRRPSRARFPACRPAATRRTGRDQEPDRRARRRANAQQRSTRSATDGRFVSRVGPRTSRRSSSRLNGTPPTA